MKLRPTSIHWVQLIKNYTSDTISFDKGDCLYLFTDGFLDQFGGPKSKKLNYSRFRELLLSLQKASFEMQQERLKKEFYDWKGNEEQVDDICVIGINL